MDFCELCEEETKTYECYMCGTRFCKNCGNAKQKVCDGCQLVDKNDY